LALDPVVALVNACIVLIESQTWESPEVKQTLLQLAKDQDSQLLALSKTLKNQSFSFVSVATKYARLRKK
jgi:hypothetical protein